ncbi:recombination protein RecR [Candidatus Kaiserbacteria bacterium]|nr:recombination protein RecR [Candidatus Kaiserbacteria bacterium]
MNNLDKLISLFESFPGVGARQAKRFAFYVLTMPEADTKELARLVSELKGSVVECASCHRFYVSQQGTTCSICNSQNRDHNRLLVVERDSDVQAIERAGVYDGLYFVLGGTVPLLHNSENNKLRGAALKATVEARLPRGLTEIILGFSINPDGENTARFVESILSPVLPETTKLTHLGRGLSTGSELEYADPETIKSALNNRN